MNEWHKLVEQNKREYVRAHVEPKDNTNGYAVFVVLAFVTIVLMVMGLYVAFPYAG